MECWVLRFERHQWMHICPGGKEHSHERISLRRIWNGPVVQLDHFSNSHVNSHVQQLDSERTDIHSNRFRPPVGPG